MEHTIQVDDEVYRHLHCNAVPFSETPNDVLRRLLLESPELKEGTDEIHLAPPGSSKGLAQVVQVAVLMRKGVSRTEATKVVARQNEVRVQTVIHKYTRQLGLLNANHFGVLVMKDNLGDLKKTLKKAFPKDPVDKVFA